VKPYTPCSERHTSLALQSSQAVPYQHPLKWLIPCNVLLRRKRGTAMQNFMSGAMVIEAALLSFLLALWITWMGLRGLFRLMPITARAADPIRLVANRQGTHREREAA
jgi:hypothetical protein